MLKLKRSIKRLFSWSAAPEFKASGDQDYLSAYADFVNQRVAKDPHEAIGGYWEVLGELQLEFLKARGLKPEHTLLDIGCGTLRGGRLLIDFLEVGKFAGYDISQAAINFAEKLISREGLTHKEPKVFYTMEGLDARELSGKTFDFLWAQSVFTHLGPQYIEEHFAQCGDLMHEGSKFYFTYEEADQFRIEREVDFAYPYTYFEELALKFGFAIKNLSDQYPHLRGQGILELSKPK